MQQPDERGVIADFDYRNTFPEFYNSPVINALADRPRWTISTNKKMPVNAEALTHWTEQFGAKEPAPPYTAPLYQIMQAVPNASNCTYYLNAEEDGIVILDVEPDCPEYLKREFLRMPALYRETSMSGKGLHLVFPCPACLRDYPDALYKKAMKEHHKWYEVLMYHWVTFTRRPVAALNDRPPKITFDALFEMLCRRQKPSVRVDITLTEEQQIPQQTTILDIVEKNMPYRKTPASFGNDMSRYEFSTAMHYMNCVNRITDYVTELSGQEYTDSDRIRLTARVLTDMLEHRPKHDERRNGMSWLVYVATQAWGHIEAKKKKTD